MKVLVFAHVPPPHHGQSQMVQYLVDGLRERPGLGIEVVHVDARLSDSLSDVGSARGGKIPRLLGHCRDAIRARQRTGARVLYYIPSPPKRSSLYRDWIALALLRPWFSRVVFHWEAVGLGRWLDEEAAPWERHVSRHLLGGVDLSIVLADANRGDAARLRPDAIRVVGNGVADPCPGFNRELAGVRQGRLAARRAAGGTVNVLYLALCTRDKGVFDAAEAVALANAAPCEPGRPLRFHLTVAGTFPEPAVEAAFRQRIAAPDLAGRVTLAGFVGGPAKAACYREADLFLFPTWYAAEGQPLNLMEAMAWGLPPVTTRWRGIPEMLPDGHPGLVEPRDPAAAAAALHTLASGEDGTGWRRRFEERFSVGVFLESMAAALRSVDSPPGS